MSRPDWDEYFIRISAEVSTRASCPRAFVGAVIVSSDHHILSTGYNGAPSGEPHCIDIGCLIKDGHCQRALHAEVNAVAWAARHGVALEGGEIYIFSRIPPYPPLPQAYSEEVVMPCRECVKVLRAAGIEVRMTRGIRGDHTYE